MRGAGIGTSSASRTVALDSASHGGGRPRADGQRLEGGLARRIPTNAPHAAPLTSRWSSMSGRGLLVRCGVGPDWGRRRRRVTGTVTPPGREARAGGRQHTHDAAVETTTRQYVMCRSPLPSDGWPTVRRGGGGAAATSAPLREQSTPSPPPHWPCTSVARTLLVRCRVDPDHGRRRRRVTATASPPGREACANGRQQRRDAAVVVRIRQWAMCRSPLPSDGWTSVRGGGGGAAATSASLREQGSTPAPPH
jgi:hypothetical protein